MAAAFGAAAQLDLLEFDEGILRLFLDFLLRLLLEMLLVLFMLFAEQREILLLGTTLQCLCRRRF